MAGSAATYGAGSAATHGAGSAVTHGAGSAATYGAGSAATYGAGSSSTGNKEYFVKLGGRVPSACSAVGDGGSVRSRAISEASQRQHEETATIVTKV